MPKGGAMKEVLNLRSQQFPMFFHQKNQRVLKETQVVELQPKTHKKMIGMMRMSESSFNVSPITVLKDIIRSYEPDAVLLDDFTNIPGAIEVITTDLKIPVILDSNQNREIIRFPAVA